MRPSLRLSALACVAASGFAFAGTALAHDHDGHRGGAFALLDGVQLSDQQQAQVHQIMRASWSQMKAQHDQMRQIESQIDARLLSSGSVTQTDLAPLVQQEEQLRQSLDMSRLQTALQVRAVLTPQQLAQASATHAQLAALHQKEDQVRNVAPPAQAQ